MKTFTYVASVAATNLAKLQKPFNESPAEANEDV